MTDALQFVFNQLLKTIFISIPGIIESYDPQKKRCRVKPAINILLTDGQTMPQSSIINVPVIWPGGGGFTFISPLPAGTPVEIKFSQRGITRFKETFLQEDPGNGIFDKEDAHVFPGYGALSIAPATEEGLSIQDEDGENYIFVENGNIEITSTVKVTINSPDTIINTDQGTINGPVKINGTLKVSDLFTAQNGMAGTGDMTLSGIIKGPNVFNGPDSDVHAHGGIVAGGDISGVPV